MKVGTSVRWAIQHVELIPAVVRLIHGSPRPQHCVELQRLGDTILGLVPSALVESLEDDPNVLSVGLISPEVL